MASYNYASFAEELYQTHFSQIAVAAYYLPDALFFISGFLLAKKGFALIEVETRTKQAIFRLISGKVIRWVPLYWAIVIIYWQISPSLHAGPIWYEYEEQAAVCNSAWWRVLFFIDNWF